MIWGQEAWYTPTKGHHSATGWLEERVKNVRKRTSTATKLLPSASLVANVPKTLPEVQLHITLSDADWEGMKEWLKNNVEPELQVRQYMEKTALKRAKWVMESPLPEIQREYPRLFDTWCLMNKRPTWQYSYCHVSSQLRCSIDVQPVGTNIPRYLEHCKTLLFILVLGEHKKAHQSFVVAGGIAQEATGLLKAVDMAFKMFYILDIEYPWQCAITWEFIQCVVFGTDSHKSKKSLQLPAISAIRAALKQLYC